MNKSDSDFSSSGSSMSSKISAVDEDMQKLGIDPIKKLIIKSYFLHLITNFLVVFSRLVEISVTLRYIGYEYIFEVLLLGVFADLLCS